MKRIRGLVLALFSVMSGTAVALAAPPLEVSIDFEGGSARVESIDQQTRRVSIVPSPHKDRGWSCWWYFKLAGIQPGETITLDVGEGSWATPDRAAMSLDGRTWQQTAPGRRQGKRIVYRQPVGAEQAYFAWGPVFTPLQADAWVQRIAEQCPEATASNLCTTRGGRPTPVLTVSPPRSNGAAPYGIWVQARQHAWEVGSTWVLKGFADWLVSDDARAEALRRRAEVRLVPIMDIDNTAIGAGGKEQKPQDHNRDWSDKPHWHSVAAAIAKIKKMDAEGRLMLFLDLHNPGAGSRRPFFYVSPDEGLADPGRANLARFLDLAKAEIAGPLRLADKSQVSGANYDKRWQRISKNWVTGHTAPHVVAVTLETAWNTPHSTVEGYETVGRQLGLAVERYVRIDPRKPLVEAAAD